MNIKSLVRGAVQRLMTTAPVLRAASGPRFNQSARSGSSASLLAALIGLSMAVLVPSVAAGESGPEACPPLLNHSFPRLQDGKPQSLCEWKGKVILVVNTASYCGYTRQYDGLEKLYAELKPRGLVVVGFPTNDFGEQEPGSNKEIADFCRTTYGVEFPMFAKTTVVGESANPFYKSLIAANGTRPKWNFHKYLIDRQGKEVLAFSSSTEPDDRKLRARIEEFLARR